MNRLATVSVITAAVAASACAGTDAPTGPRTAPRASQVVVTAQPSTCPKPTPRPSREVQLLALPLSPLPLSIVGVVQTNVLFTNATCEVLEMYWVRPNAEQVFNGTLQPGGTNRQLTYVGHVWLIKRTDGTPYAVFRIEDYPLGAQEVYLGCTKGKNAVCN